MRISDRQYHRSCEGSPFSVPTSTFTAKQAVSSSGARANSGFMEYDGFTSGLKEYKFDIDNPYDPPQFLHKPRTSFRLFNRVQSIRHISLIGPL
jgi:hypothetical protein